MNCPDFIPRLFELFAHRKRVIKKEAFWTLSNIAAGNQRQIDLILKHPNWHKAIKKAVKKEPFEVSKRKSILRW